MFKFRLQRILELRAEKEKAQARALASAQQTAEMAVQTQEMIAAIRNDSRAQMQAATQASPRVGHLTQLGSVLDSLDTRLSDATEAVESADAMVAQAQQFLEAAARDRRVLDRLKVRHEETHRVEEALKDRVTMDEIALVRFAQKKQDVTQESVSGDDAAPATTTDRPTR
jgi:flagellar protein FliJ